jgi:predicted dehydrogenase
MRAAIVGAGSISRVLLPSIMNSPCSIEGIISRSGESARRAAHRYGIGRVYDSLDQIDTDAAFVLTSCPHEHRDPRVDCPAAA